jgi:hypothetical protein
VLATKHVEDAVDIFFVLHLHVLRERVLAATAARLAGLRSSLVQMSFSDGLLDGFNFLDLYLLTFLQGLQEHNNQLFVSFGEESVLD